MLLSSATFSAAVLTACDGGASEPPFLFETSPTPTEEATREPPPESGGMDGFREFAWLLDDVVQSGNGSLLERQALPAIDYWSGDAGFIGAPRERVRTGFEYLMSETLVEESDEFGGGEVRLHALARRAEEPAYQENRYQAIISAIVPQSYPPREPYRNVTVYEFAFRDGRWRLVTVFVNPHAGLSVYPFAGAWLRGECDICFDHWERWEGTP